MAVVSAVLTFVNAIAENSVINEPSTSQEPRCSDR